MCAQEGIDYKMSLIDEQAQWIVDEAKQTASSTGTLTWSKFH